MYADATFLTSRLRLSLRLKTMKIAVCGNYGAKNIGDEMILRGLLEALKNLVPNAEITVLSGDPMNTSQLHGVKAVPKFPAGIRSFFQYIFDKNSETKKAVKECDYFILGGGGLFASLKKRANFIWGIQALFSNHYKKSIIFYGQSVESLDNRLEEIFVKFIFKKAKFIGVRDNNTKQLLEGLNMSKEIVLMPDLALRYDSEKINSGEAVNAAVILRESNRTGPTFNTEMANFIDWLIDEKKIKVKLINFHCGSFREKILYDDIYGKIKGKTNVEQVMEVINFNNLNKIFADVKIIIGMPFHSIIYAVKNETPFVAIEYAKKLTSFLNDTNLAEAGIAPENATMQNLKEKYLQLEQNYQTIVTKLQVYKGQAITKHKEVEEKLRVVLV